MYMQQINMKVVFKVIRAGSGNDVYFERLAKGLQKQHIDASIRYYHKYFQFVPWLLKFFTRSTDADVVHSNAEYGWVFKEKNKPLFVSLLHNVFEKTYQKQTSFFQKIFHYLIVRPNIKKTLSIADKIIAISQYTKSSFAKEFKIKNIEVQYCTIDTDVYKPISVVSKDKRFKLFFVGNLIKRKGADLLPIIMKRLGNEYVLYYTSGLRSKPPKEFDVPNMIPLSKLSEKDLVIEYNKCDALLFPTRLEGFGYAVAEAMACGKPVVSTKTSSIPELVEDRKNGFLCNIDDVECYVEKVKLLTTSPKICLKMTKSNRVKVINILNQQDLSNFYVI